MNDRLDSPALAQLLTRYSVSPKHLGAPGPTPEQLRTVFAAALRAPDHGKLTPFRFVVVDGEGLGRLADLFVDYGRRHGKGAEALEQERTRAMQAPTVIAVVARITPEHEVPMHEQWIAVGGAIANVVNALHFMGYGAKMLSGIRATDPELGRAFCGPGERLVGWISAGTPRTPARPRAVDRLDEVFRRF